MIDCFQPIIKYNIQLIHQIRHKGFYKYVSNEKTYYLVPMDFLLDITKNHYKKDITEITINNKQLDSNYKYMKGQQYFNDYLVGFEIFNEEKKYFTTKFRKLPQYTNYCYKNIVAL